MEAADDAAHQAEIAIRLGWLDVGRPDAHRRSTSCGLRGRGARGRLHPRRAVRHGRLVAGAGSAAAHVRRRKGASTSPCSTRPIPQPSPRPMQLERPRARRSTSSRPSRAARPSRNVFFQYFCERVQREARRRTPARTSSPSPIPARAMEKRAREHGFRRIFLNRRRSAGATRRSRTSASCRRRSWASTSRSCWRAPSA